MIDWILDRYIYPLRPKPSTQRSFKTYDVGGSECLVVTRQDASCWLLYCHGNSVTIDDLHASGIPRMMTEQCRCNFVAPEFPAKVHTGHDHDVAVQSTVQQAYHYLCENSNAPVYVVGRSLGVGVALAACHKKEPAGLMLVSGFASIRNLAPSWLYYFIPDRYNNVKKINQYSCPTVIVHGRNDSLVPLENAVLLKSAAQHDVQSHILPMGHNPEPKDWSLIISYCSKMMQDSLPVVSPLPFAEYIETQA